MRPFGLLAHLTWAILAVWIADSCHAQTIRERIRERRESRKAAPSREPGTATARPQATCSNNQNVGFQIVNFSGGRKAAVWYPTLAPEKSQAYANGLASGLANGAPVADCGMQYPLVVFSHGFGGCGTQSVFFTETLARRGYIVIAPDHKDARCKVDQPRQGGGFARPETPFREPQKWTDKSFSDRRDDVRAILDEIPRMKEFSGRVDMQRVGGVGHSLGGYTLMGMAGGWDSWKDSRIKVVLLFSPFAAPFLEQNKLSQIRVPVMYQGGERDVGITPGLRKAGGVYERSNAPKYYLELKTQGHLDWTVKACESQGTVEGCVKASDRLQAVIETGAEFLNRYITASLAESGSDLRTFAKPAVVADFRSQAR
jgi:predicted dienelactone hydrolase